jgi:hypothetical protein
MQVIHLRKSINGRVSKPFIAGLNWKTAVTVTSIFIFKIQLEEGYNLSKQNVRKLRERTLLVKRIWKRPAIYCCRLIWLHPLLSSTCIGNIYLQHREQKV